METNALKSILDTMTLATLTGDRGCFEGGLRTLIGECISNGFRPAIEREIESIDEHDNLTAITVIAGARAARVEWTVDSYYNDDGGYGTDVDAVTIIFDDGYRFDIGSDDIPSRAEYEAEAKENGIGEDDDTLAFFNHGGCADGVCCDEIKEICRFFYDRFGGASITLK